MESQNLVVETQMVHDNEAKNRSQKQSCVCSVVGYGPSEPDLIKTALMEAKRIWNSSGLEWTVLTNDPRNFK